MKNIILNRDELEGFVYRGDGAEFKVRSASSEVVRVTVLIGEPFDSTPYDRCMLIHIGQVWESKNGYREIRNRD